MISAKAINMVYLYTYVYHVTCETESHNTVLLVFVAELFAERNSFVHVYACCAFVLLFHFN